MTGEVTEELTAPRGASAASSAAAPTTGEGATGRRRPARARRLDRVVVVGIGALGAWELARAAAITRNLANEDTSLIWLAARDLMAGRLRQPNF